MAAACAASPTDSFPRQDATIAGREAMYRFFSNPKVTMAKLLEGHVESTIKRLEGRRVVRLLHDSSSFEFSGERAGLGVTLGKKMGFIGHFTLALGADEAREPLGVIAATTFIHADAVKNRGLSMSERTKLSAKKPRAEKESSRWERQAIAAEALLPAGTHGVHVMDQEADDFVMLGELHRSGLGFVVRGSPKRLTTDGPQANVLLERQPATVFRAVRLSTRTTKKNGSLNKTRLPRVERDAHLEIRWGQVSLPRRLCTPYDLDELSINAVHVFEPHPPDGQQAIDWMLFTSEDVTSVEGAIAVVDHYRARWVIEEYFKALKTGCAIEKRQLTSYEALTNALALFIPIAWHLLTLRHLSRIEPIRKAASLFSTEQLLLLTLMMKRHGYTLADSPTIRDAMLGIAALGGHIRNNGDRKSVV